MKHNVHWINRGVRRLLLTALSASALGGGSGLNVAVVVNQDSPDSVALGNYYRERRQLPSQHLVRISWTGGRTDWTRAECQDRLIDPVTVQLAQRGLGDQIDFVVVSMDIPYRVLDGPDVNSTTSVLFYGFRTNDWRKPGPCLISPESDHEYFGSELPFRPRPAVGNGPRYLATMLTADTLAEAKHVVDRGTLSDSTFPTQTVLLQKTSDAARNVRFLGFDNAVFQMQLIGLFPLIVTNSNQTLGLAGLLGLQTGLGQFDLDANTFVPGAMADSLTSFGGILFEPTDQTNLLAFLRAGATASYGTVVEPCNYPDKFPAATAYFYQARGFALAECYYQSLASPYQGLVVGEPLAAPCAQPGQGAWLATVGPDLLTAGNEPHGRPSLHAPPPTEAPVLAGTTNLSLRFLAADATRPLQEVDLYVDGTLAFTLTNVPPSAGNVVSVKINRITVESTVPPAATLESVATKLASALNAKSNLTQVAATAVGDRVELASLDAARAGGEVNLTTSHSIGSAAALTTFIRPSRSRFLDSTAQGRREFEIRGTASVDDFLRCTLVKTNGDRIPIGVTNQSPPLSTVDLTLRLLDQLNTSPLLQGADGVSAGDVLAPSDSLIHFWLIVRSPGPAAAQMRIEWDGSSRLAIDPRTPQGLDENLADLRPRNHLYLTAGSTRLDLVFPFDTSRYADGYHELTAVAYEGSSVRTQARATTIARIRNTPLEATLRNHLDSSEVAVEASLPFEVVANRPQIERIDLFGTGGWLAGATNTAAAVFALTGTQLGPGLHAFYAAVVASDGTRYRTAPVELRLVARETPFLVALSGRPPGLSWPGVLGRTYEVLSGETALNVGHLEATLLSPGTGTVHWRIPEPPAPTRFYRIRVQ